MRLKEISSLTSPSSLPSNRRLSWLAHIHRVNIKRRLTTGKFPQVDVKTRALKIVWIESAWAASRALHLWSFQHLIRWERVRKKAACSLIKIRVRLLKQHRSHLLSTIRLVSTDSTPIDNQMTPLNEVILFSTTVRQILLKGSWPFAKAISHKQQVLLTTSAVPTRHTSSPMDLSSSLSPPVWPCPAAPRSATRWSRTSLWSVIRGRPLPRTKLAMASMSSSCIRTTTGWKRRRSDLPCRRYPQLLSWRQVAVSLRRSNRKFLLQVIIRKRKD